MKLSTIATLAPGAVVPLSSRDPGKNGDGPDFGSLLGDMTPDVPSEAIAAGSVEPGSQPAVVSKPGTEAALDAMPIIRATNGALADPEQPSAGDGSTQPSSLFRAARPSTTVSVTPAGTAGDALPVVDLLALATRAADQSNPGSSTWKSLPDATSKTALRVPVADGQDVDPSQQGTDRILKKRFSSDQDSVPGAIDQTMAGSASPMVAAGLVVAPAAIVATGVPDANASVSREAASQPGAPTQAEPRGRGSESAAAPADESARPADGSARRGDDLLRPREDLAGPQVSLENPAGGLATAADDLVRPSDGLAGAGDLLAKPTDSLSKPVDALAVPAVSLARSADGSAPQADGSVVPATWDTVDVAEGPAAPANISVDRPTPSAPDPTTGPSMTASTIAPITPPASSIDSRIVAGTVRTESHLGFRTALSSALDPAGVAATAASEPPVVSTAERASAGPATAPALLSAFAGFAEMQAPVPASRVGAARPSANTAGVASASSRASDDPVIAPPSVDDTTPAVALAKVDLADAAPTSASAVHVASASSSRASEEADVAPPSMTDAAPAVASAEMVSAMPRPTGAPPVAQQVADAIVTLAAPPPDQAMRALQVAPARTMALQLAPAGMGMVTVRLHISGRALDIALDVADGQTAALIDRERDALTGALRSADYQLQSLSVTTHDATMPGNPHADRGTDARSSDPSTSERSPDGGASGGREGGTGSRDQPDRGSTPQRRPSPRAASLRGDAALFV